MAALALGAVPALLAQSKGDRPASASGVHVLNPRARVPVGLIIDDSTCLVNLNRFAMPQFDEAHGHQNPSFHKPWRDWPAEIPDAFVRKFGEWCASAGVKGKYSIVPYPACVGRVDRELPGWTRRELSESLQLVREVMMPNWDIHPEMVTHTRVIDIRTGHPLRDYSLKSMENWEWTTGKSTDELAAYLAYALNILKEAGLSCEGITTPGGFGNRVLPELAQATLQSVRQVFSPEIPHYFRHLFTGSESVSPRVEYASGLSTNDPQCVVSIIGCTGDWTGGWDCTPPEGADKFVTADLRSGRMVEVIERGEPAMMVCHWTGIYWNGQELGFKVFQEVVRRLHERYSDKLLWMKLSEVARYWAARELTKIENSDAGIVFEAPYACPNFTVRVPSPAGKEPRFGADQPRPIRETGSLRDLKATAWCRQGNEAILCLDLPRGKSKLIWES